VVRVGSGPARHGASMGRQRRRAKKRAARRTAGWADRGPRREAGRGGGKREERDGKEDREGRRGKLGCDMT
jgi:hypothetical protein